MSTPSLSLLTRIEISFFLFPTKARLGGSAIARLASSEARNASPPKRRPRLASTEIEFTLSRAYRLAVGRRRGRPIGPFFVAALLDQRRIGWSERTYASTYRAGSAARPQRITGSRVKSNGRRETCDRARAYVAIYDFILYTTRAALLVRARDVRHVRRASKKAPSRCARKSVSLSKRAV